MAPLAARRDGAIALLNGYNGPASRLDFDNTDAWLTGIPRSTAPGPSKVLAD